MLKYDTRSIIKVVSVIYSLTTAFLVILGALVMMYGNFDLGLILFVLGLVLVIGNESIFPKLLNPQGKDAQTTIVEEVANIAAIGYTPPILLGFYLYVSGQSDYKLLVFLAVSFVVVTMKIVAKALASQISMGPKYWTENGVEHYKF